ncbi:DUF6911 family protein [Neisseria lactamica]|uniref:DUF6911 family protein n=1 Tax=Neisseria lactamica TaxID=486 RepID=UPI000E598FC5|nr:hypothetical protein [Neisseria lactamica]
MKTSTVVFGGFFITDNGERIQIPVLENPDIREINRFFSVSNFEKKAGVLVFRIIPEPKFGNTELTIYFEEGCYLPMIQTILEDGDIEVKNLKTENYSGKAREILGDSYPIEHTSKNISAIQNIISEFIRQKQTPAPMV